MGILKRAKRDNARRRPASLREFIELNTPAPMAAQPTDTIPQWVTQTPRVLPAQQPPPGYEPPPPVFPFDVGEEYRQRAFMADNQQIPRHSLSALASNHPGTHDTFAGWSNGFNAPPMASGPSGGMQQPYVYRGGLEPPDAPFTPEPIPFSAEDEAWQDSVRRNRGLGFSRR